VGVRRQPACDNNQFSTPQNTARAEDDDDARQRRHGPLRHRSAGRDLRRSAKVRLQAGPGEQWEVVQRR